MSPKAALQAASLALATSPGARWSTCAARAGPLIDMNQHTAGGSDQVCVGVSDEHARV